MHEDPEPPDFMAKAKLKPLLKLSRRRPVSCAICFSKDRDGIIFLHKRMKPRRALAELRRKAKALGLDLNLATLRFGHAQVDGASDSQKVRLTVNKMSPGAMRLAILAHLRPAGFQRCEILVDEELDNAPDDDEEDDEEESDDDENDEEDDDDDEDPALLRQLSALRIDLAHLVKDMLPVVAHDPARKQKLLDLAQGAQASLKDDDAEGAAKRIEALRTALHGPSSKP